MTHRLKLSIIRLAADISERLPRRPRYHRIMMSDWWGDDLRALMYRKMFQSVCEGLAEGYDNAILYGTGE